MLAAVLLSLFSLRLSAQENSEYPVLDGYVTRATADDFEVNGVHLLFTPASLLGIPVEGGIHFSHEVPATYLGQPAKVFGTTDHKHDTVKVDRLILISPAVTEVSGEAIIDLLPTSPLGAPTTDRLLRADGRLLLLTPGANVVFTPPLVATTPLATNLWIRYRGEQSSDGTVLLREAQIRENVIAASEDKLRTRKEYDPTAVGPDAHQNAVGKYFFGLDTKKLPPWPDEAMQQRVSSIGAKLVPAYQRALPASDPTRINFRFGVIDNRDLSDALTLPNGIILIPYQVIERLENDSQLATVLADNVACAIEKQTLRITPARQKMTAAAIAGNAAGLVVPGLGLATGVANYSVAKHLLTVEEQQSGRTSLSYLHDAGFDLTQAPVAWWRLGTKPGKPLSRQSLPPRAAYLFATLGTSWRNTVSPDFHQAARHDAAAYQTAAHEPAGVPVP